MTAKVVGDNGAQYTVKYNGRFVTTIMHVGVTFVGPDEANPLRVVEGQITKHEKDTTWSLGS